MNPIPAWVTFLDLASCVVVFICISYWRFRARRENHSRSDHNIQDLNEESCLDIEINSLAPLFGPRCSLEFRVQLF